MSKRKAPSASAKQKHKRCSVPKPAKETVKAALNSMVLQIEKKKADNEENKTPYGTITGFVTDNKQMFPWLTVNKIKYHMRKLNKKLSSMEAKIMDEEVEEINEQSANVSDLTNDASEATSNHFGGRPKGTTNDYSANLSYRVGLAKNEAAEHYFKIKSVAKAKGITAKPRALTQVVEKAREKYNIPSTVAISIETIRSRAKRGNCKVAHRGTPSPMEKVEQYIVEIASQLAKMRQPISCRQGLELANSLITGNVLETDVRAWKKKHCTALSKSENYDEGDAEDANTSDTRLLGTGYWRGFMRRHGYRIGAKRGVRFDKNRDDWCTYQNFSSMYDDIYVMLVETGIATKLDTAQWFDKQGNIVESEEEAFGRKSQYFLLHPEKMIFVDEVGSNTSQKNDGHCGSEKFLVPVNIRPQIHAASKDSHFTVLGFTAATGEPICCAIIFAAKQLDPQWVTGVDPFCEWAGEEDDMAINMGKGKRYPLGPDCVVGGKTIPTLCCCSENGSITSELLSKMLSHIDSTGAIDRSDGIPPFLLLDGHGSRFEMPFLEYIQDEKNEGHKWTTCVGVPYGTSYWQVGDSAEQNGSFKIALSRAKTELLEKKSMARLPFAIEKTDVVIIMSAAWELSFNNVATNRKAIAERGWGPLNYVLLDHPEIAANGVIDSMGRSVALSGTVTVSAMELNMQEGIAGTLINKLVDLKNRERSHETDRDLHATRRIATVKENLKTAK